MLLISGKRRCVARRKPLIFRKINPLAARRSAECLNYLFHHLFGVCEQHHRVVAVE
jgi:hypothetical protein